LVVPKRSSDNYWLQPLVANNPLYQWQRTTYIDPITTRRVSRWAAVTYSGDTLPDESILQHVPNIPDTDRVEIISNSVPVDRENGEMKIYSVFSRENNVYVRHDGNN
jgi:hypothetical protein